ncbi:MAG: M28 family peptidase [Chloroflexaceae bacterium]|nr:M28 family peptidase [Chloroflexaceae bacterium]
MCTCHKPYCRRTHRTLISRRQLLKTMLLLAGGAAVPNIFGSSGGLAAKTPALPPLLHANLFDGSRAMQHAAAQMQYIPRDTGSEGARLCGNYILAQMEAFGWQTEEQTFTYRNTPCRNLIGKRGSGPVLIIGAHYDTRRRADNDPDPANREMPVPGASDGASGIAVLLELARVLVPEETGRTISRGGLRCRRQRTARWVGLDCWLALYGR